MGDVISSHLDEAKREIITARTGELMGRFGQQYEQQYAVVLFNKVRFDTEGGVGPQPQLLHRKVPLENKSIFSGSLFQYLEENKKWRNRFLFIPDSYNINIYDSKQSYDRRVHPRGAINCAGYKVLTSMEQYLDLISNCLPGTKAKVGNAPFLKCPTQFPLILWHPYGRHHYFCLATEKEQQKWHAVLQDCVRHTNDGLSEENKVQTPAFTDAVRLYRQAQGHYGTWEMMCGVPAQILSNLVMEDLLPELRELISPRLKGKLHDRHRNWILISDAVYSLVQAQCQAQYEAVVQRCEAARSALEASIRKDMDQIITSKEHVTNKIRAVVLPKAEKLLKVSIQPYISSILEALMEPTSRGFSEVREVFFSELVDMSKNTLNDGTKEALAPHMEKVSMLAYHPVKMQSCYEKVERLSLDGLQQRFDVSSPAVFVQRAQILMREQMDDAVYTFEQILHQSLEAQGSEELCKTIQRCQDRVIKKFDYDSSTVRKRFFREALLQIFIPYMLKQLSPTCAPELPRFQELIFEDFSRFILVESIFEEVVLHSVMKDIMMAVKEAAVQRRHNLYRDSIVLSNSDPSLHLLGENPSIDWAGEYGGGAGQDEVEGPGGEDDALAEGEGEGGESQKRRRMKQVVSMIQVEGSPELLNEPCMVPDIDDIPEEDGEEEEGGEEVEEKDKDGEGNADGKVSPKQNGSMSPKASENPPDVSNGSVSKEEEAKPEEQDQEVPLKVDTAPESASGAGEQMKGEDGQPTVEKQPSSVQEGSPPTPNPSGDVPSESDPASPAESAPEGAPEVEEKVKEADSLPTVEKEPEEEEALKQKIPADEVPSGAPETAPECAPDTGKECQENQPSSDQEALLSSSPPPSTVDVLPGGAPEKAPEKAPDVEEEKAPEKEEEASQPTVEGQPSSVQDALEESLPLPPPPPSSEDVPPCGAPETCPGGGSLPGETSDLPPPPPHDDSGFQSPTSDAEEPAVVPKPTEEHPPGGTEEEVKTDPAPEEEAAESSKASDCKAADQ